MKKSNKVHKILAIILFVSLLIGLTFSTVRLILAPVESSGDEAERVKTDYLLMVVECLADLLVMTLPAKLDARFFSAHPLQHVYSL